MAKRKRTASAESAQQAASEALAMAVQTLMQRGTPLDDAMRQVAVVAGAPLAAAMAAAAAELRALAEQPAEYALILPSADPAAVVGGTPAYALLARNTGLAALAAPAPVAYTQQIGMDDDPADIVSISTRLLVNSLSVDAQRLLYLLGGRWDAQYRSENCNAEKGQHAPECAHLQNRSVPITLRALARDCYGSDGGRQVERITELLSELEAARLEVRTTRTAGITEQTLGRAAEPLVVVAMAEARLTGTGRRLHKNLAAADEQRTALFSRDLHDEYLRGQYRLIRRDLLTGWGEEWRLELLLRLYTHPALYYGSSTMRTGTDGRSAQITLGRTAPAKLGSLSDLLPSAVGRVDHATRRLDEFRAELNERSLPDELHIAAIRPAKTGRRITGWVLGCVYPAPRLTGRQARSLLRRGHLNLTPDERLSLTAYQQRTGRVQIAQQARTSSALIEAKTGAGYPVDTQLDTPSAKALNAIESATAKGDRIAEYRQQWATYPASVRRTLKRSHPELAEQPD